MLAFDKKGSGPAVILLHGLLGSRANLAGVAGSLSEIFQVYGLDLRNHGDSFHHDSMTYADMACDLIDFMDSQEIETATLIGHSMGGKCAMTAAFHHPDRVKSLVIVDIAPKVYANIFWKKYVQAMLNLDLSAVKKRSDADRMLAEDIPEILYRQFLLQNLELTGRETYAWRADLSAIQKNAEEVAKAVEGPAYNGETLFLKGENSPFILDEDRQMITGLFPGAKIETITGAAHLPHVENKEMFCRTVNRFLNHMSV